MNCLNPIDIAVLADYWLAAPPNSGEEAIEVHLFVCDECGTRLREVIALAEEIRKLARQGSRVTFQQSIAYAKAAPSDTMIARLIAFDEPGREHLLGGYTFHHTRTIPGPGAW